ncbi:MAG: hypothetical protein J2P36_29105, partial [Ktedonobacteraceae bacterium]|nr:hypothetical protein [Ktedonobacteraceae bacterium]
MSIIKRYHMFELLAAMSILLLLSACSQIPLGNSGSSLSLGDVLQKSTDAMKQLKTAHIDLQSNSSAQASNATPGAVTNSGLPTATSTPTNFTAAIKGSGDVVLPNQEQLNLTINQNTKVAEIVQDGKIYVQNTQGKWFVLDKDRFQGLTGNPFAGVQLDQKSLLGLIQHANITDHGTEALNGQQLRHASADLDKDALRQLFDSNPQLKSMVGQQITDNILDRTKTFKSSLDVWIDETQFYVHRTELKLNLTADTAGTVGAAPSSVTTNLDTIIDLSKFNDPVTIAPPADA